MAAESVKSAIPKEIIDYLSLTFKKGKTVKVTIPYRIKFLGEFINHLPSLPAKEVGVLARKKTYSFGTHVATVLIFQDQFGNIKTKRIRV